MKTKIAIASIVAVCLSACNSGTTTSSTDQKSMDSTSISAVKTDSSKTTKSDTSMAGMNHDKMDDGQFLTMAYNISQFEIEAAKLAKKNGSDAKVKDFASKMTTDHTLMSKSIADVAKKQNVTLPAEIDPKHKEKWDKLNGMKGKEFDKEYADMMVKGHGECIEHFETAAKEEHSADVKALVNSSLPKLNEHKKLAEGMQSAVASK